MMVIGTLLILMLAGLFLLGMFELMFFGFIILLALGLFAVSPKLLILIIILVILVKAVD